MNTKTIIRTIATEKSSMQQGRGQYAFEVRRNASKVEIKKAVKSIYGVDAKDVKIIIAPSKKRMVGRGRILTKRPVLKKAIVTLKDKKTIDPNKISEKAKTK